MKTLIINSRMTALIGGTFYPTGYSIVMFPSEMQARAAAQLLLEHGFSGDDLYFVPPADVLSKIAATIGDADQPLPSAGTEASTVRELIKFANDGHFGLLVANHKDRDRMMNTLQGTGYSIARRYHALVIEDL